VFTLSLHRRDRHTMDEQQDFHGCTCTLNQRINGCCIAKRFGRILRKARIEACLSPSQLSRVIRRRCGVHHSARSIYRYESGVHSPPLEFLVVASLVLNPEIFSDLLTEILSPGLIGSYKMQSAAAHYDNSGQMKLFE